MGRYCKLPMLMGGVKLDAHVAGNFEEFPVLMVHGKNPCCTHFCSVFFGVEFSNFGLGLDERFG